MSSKTPVDYGLLLSNLKEKIRRARQRAAFSVNAELLFVYWEIGKVILEKKEDAGWGAKIVKQLGADLRSEFPDMKGFSDRNLIYMQTFASAYPDFSITQQVAAQTKTNDSQQITFLQQSAAKLPWGHHQVILDKIKTSVERKFYIGKCVENNWSRNILIHQIETGLYKRQGSLTHNFNNTLPEYQSELTQQIFKDPYQFDFLMLSEKAKERDLENALITHIMKLLLELGDGFAFMGRQKKFEVGGQEFFIDLLFYHTRLRRHIIIELKIGEFEAEYVSKMNLYLGLADDRLKGELDEPSIGLILCKTKNKIVAEYALRDTSKPIGIAEYKISEMLPEDIKQELPSIAELEQKLDEDLTKTSNSIEKRLSRIKERIQNLNVDEIKTELTEDLLVSVFKNGLKPLYERLQKTLNEFNSYFQSHKIYWQLPGLTVNSLVELQNVMNQPPAREALRKGDSIEFCHNFFAFKKAPHEELGHTMRLTFKYETYWYSFGVAQYNDHHPFMKKMYHETLSNKDMDTIEEIVVGQLADRIEWIVEHVEKNQNNTK